MKHNLDLIDEKYSEQKLEENINIFNKMDWFFICCYQKLSE